MTHTSGPDRESLYASLTADGTVVVFDSDSDLLNEGISNDQGEIWLYDSTTQELRRLTHASGPDRRSRRPIISADGSIIVFYSDSDFLNEGIADGQYEIWLYTVETGELTRITESFGGSCFNLFPEISADGSTIVFYSNCDANNEGIQEDQIEIWLYQRADERLQRLTRASAGGRTSSGCVLSYDGSIVAFNSDSALLGKDIADDQFEIWLWQALP